MPHCLEGVFLKLRFRAAAAIGILSVVSVLSACGGGGVGGVGNAPPTRTPTPAPAVTCPPPPTTPTPIPGWLAYPPNGSTNLAINIGEIIEQGADYGLGGLTVTVSSSSVNLPLGTPTIAPSPYPTPFAMSPPEFINHTEPYIAIPLPTLSPATTYTVSDVYTGWADNPPQCSAQYGQFMGSFATGQ